ncbi:hypothetical protein RFI_00644 [Reticulomyxa filosa]|uniref:Uncharacterized protein n=1 Tax=Reticulomyxa filosa TaxID=46433 RepID=X6PEG5_RETFI|nr:hypothetical protein RFI_00644 [Reticulomyxa filosa]|eukprot:ETO36419.1 hypothetical protein RFI_00644 [Reticulomyxa filosa]
MEQKSEHEDPMIKEIDSTETGMNIGASVDEDRGPDRDEIDSDDPSLSQIQTLGSESKNRDQLALVLRQPSTEEEEEEEEEEETNENLLLSQDKPFHNEEEYQQEIHPIHILAKNQYFDDLFRFLQYPDDAIAHEAWKILQHLPVNRHHFDIIQKMKPEWIKYFDSRYNPLLTARYALNIIYQLAYEEGPFINDRRSCSVWLRTFVSSRGLVPLLELALKTNVVGVFKTKDRSDPEMAYFAVVTTLLETIIEYMGDILQKQHQSLQLILSAQFVNHLFNMIFVLSSFNEDMTDHDAKDDTWRDTTNTGVYGPHLPSLQMHDCNPMHSREKRNTWNYVTNDLLLSYAIRCLGLIEFVLLHDVNKTILNHILNADLCSWLFQVLLQCSNHTLKCQIKRRLLLMLTKYFPLGETASKIMTSNLPKKIPKQNEAFSEKAIQETLLPRLQSLADNTQDPSLHFKFLKCGLSLLGLDVPTGSIGIEKEKPLKIVDQYKFQCFFLLRLIIRLLEDLCSTFAVLVKYPDLKTIIIPTTKQSKVVGGLTRVECVTNDMTWDDLFVKFVKYLESYPVTESSLDAPKAEALLTHCDHCEKLCFSWWICTDTKESPQGDQCLQGSMVMAHLILTHVPNIKQTVLSKCNLTAFIDFLYSKGLFPDVRQQVEHDKGDMYYLPLCKQVVTRMNAVNLLSELGEVSPQHHQHLIHIMILHHTNQRTNQHFYDQNWFYANLVSHRSFASFVCFLYLLFA